ncbi:hypothetical protein [Agrococcus sp. HG114]|uniref:hypothetical protein n=1 Tax=Agrococcus sp. HG114 TaxID=2969757 RepID=UPI00215AD6A0|nr:hypothetical protein [Agrococcus sp. HG114]MCR8671712.1 hypothetical protein [Agrococcus sp. HG114]
MAGRMPEFEMPPAVEPAAEAAPAPPSPPAPEVLEDEAEPDASAPLATRRRFVWKHVVAAGVLGLVVGVGVPATLEIMDRATAAGALEDLRSTALAYVDAIARGDSRAASDMVPIRGLAYAAPPQVLASARPIEVPEVEVVHVEGDRGTAEVHYRVQGVDVFRTMQAERVEGRWQLRTSLAEVVDMSGLDPGIRAEVAGVQLTGFLPIMLYPGVYRVDEVAGPVIVVGGDVFTVDGDPRTPAAPRVTVTVVRAVGERAIALAAAQVDSCWERSGCLVPRGVRLRFDDLAHVVNVDPIARTVDLAVGFTTLDEPGRESFDVQVRVALDEHDRPLRWECGQPGWFASRLEPCG